ncbi:ABC-2 type transport system permease protein [Actinokineospora alba]|uniref:ABC-2 type transport system permease protein n=1 Tax=Actinokineospora alba TaxID=504798 RepID=A0A1H0T8U5_9PSEU|nr:ABC-2 type transport system permease protein [Actinokineospora alba]SDJ21530.1 ABC-2 type transport system permease protein [Actinokineospora alba]SDP50462.1 ABC-2 type transport system permease protein [Actinokineospora alba]
MPVVHAGRTFSRAVEDLRQGFAQRELWGHLGWQDIKQRYRRSVIGPLWITLSMAVTAAGLGVLYATLFDTDIKTFLPYLTVGFIVWNFMLGCMTEGADTFISNEGLIKHLPAPLTVYALRTVWRLALMFLHNLLVYVVVLAIFFPYLVQDGYFLSPGGLPQPGLDWTIINAVPAFVLLALNGTWVALLFGIISTRYRDIPQVIGALTQLLFFMTPIVWPVDLITRKLGTSAGWMVWVAELNPLYHFIQIIRAPLIGSQQSWHHWAVVGGITIVGWALAMLAMRNYRSRVSYWV